MIYSIPYVILVLIYGLLADYYRRTDEAGKSRINMVCIAIFLFFFGFRGFVAHDWSNYYPVFEHLSSANLSDFFNSFDEASFEPGFVLLMLCCKSVFDSYHFMVFVVVLINAFLLFRFIFKNLSNPPLALIVFLCMGGLIIELNLLRNSISILIFLNTLGYIRERKPLPFFLWNLLGMTFHVSSILYLPLYFCLNKRCPKWLFLSLLIVGNIVFLSGIKFVTPILIAVASNLGEVYVDLVEAYTEGKYSDIQLTLSIGYIERVLSGILIFCYYDKLIALRKDNVMYINAFLIFYILFFIFAEFAVIGGRLANLFTFCYWVLWIDLLKCISLPNNRRLYVGYLAVYCLLKTVSSTDEELYYYDNLLTGSKSYEERLYIYTRVFEVDE